MSAHRQPPSNSVPEALQTFSSEPLPSTASFLKPPRVLSVVPASGTTCERWGELRAEARVIRLMHQAKLKARHKRRRLPGDTGERLENHIAPNHLQRVFEPSGPNQKWVADFTNIWSVES